MKVFINEKKYEYERIFFKLMEKRKVNRIRNVNDLPEYMFHTPAPKNTGGNFSHLMFETQATKTQKLPNFMTPRPKQRPNAPPEMNKCKRLKIEIDRKEIDKVKRSLKF